MNKLVTVFNFEFKEYLKKKSTIITFAIYFIIAMGITFIPTLFGDNGVLKNLFAGEDNSNFQRSAYIVKDVPNFSIDKAYLKDAKEYNDKETLIQDIKAEKLDEGVVLTKDGYEYLTTKSVMEGSTSDFNNVFDRFVKKYIYEQNGLDYLKIQEIDTTVPKAKFVSVSSDKSEEAVAANFAIGYGLTFVLYFMVLMFGSVLAMNVAREKTNRAMELLVVTVRPTILILGKVLAFSAIALMQVGLLVCSLLVGLKINSNNYSSAVKFFMENINKNIFFVWMLFAITGLLMLMFLYTACASLASRIEEVNTVITLPMLLFIGAFFGNLYTMNSIDGSLAKILSYVPLTSYFSMVSRYAISDVSFSELAVSYILLVVATIVIALISIKVYRAATLRYGQKLSFFKVLFSKE